MMSTVNIDRNSDSSGSRMTSSSGSMNRYVTIKKLGDGSYGEVVLGQRIDTGERVAIKKLVTKSMFASEVCSKETKAFLTVGYALITAKTHVKIYFCALAEF